MRRLAALWLSALICVTGCSAFLPAHRNSQVRENETVELAMLSRADVEGDPALLADWKEAFGMAPVACTPGNEAPMFGPLAAAPAAMAVAGVAIDMAAAALRREATEYESQFSVAKAADRFWVAPGEPGEPKKPFYAGPVPYAKLCQHYYGFRLTRKAGDPVTDAFELVVGIAPSVDEQMFRLAPLLLQVPRARAKVLSDAWYWWVVPTSLIGKIFRNGGHEIDVLAAIAVEAYWKDKDQKLQVAKLTSNEWRFPSYSIDQPVPLRAKCSPLGKPPECLPLALGASGWLLSVPVSVAPGSSSEVVGRGTFTVDVTVTERDRSNARQYLESGARLLTEQKPRILEQLGNRLGAQQ